VETDRQHQQTLEQYFAWMTELLLKNELTGANGTTARSIARTRTFAALRLLDGGRKAQLIQFLYEAGLLDRNQPFRLYGADLRQADLQEATLQNADLRGIYFVGASLRSAQLAGADLRGSDLTEADLTGANLKGADLTQANFKGARLRKADLTSAKTDEAIFTGTDLKGAKGTAPGTP
jgi:uncharacterized protein YjbI with pentapeptide repeats